MEADDRQPLEQAVGVGGRGLATAHPPDCRSAPMAILPNATLPLANADGPYFSALFWHNLTVLNMVIATMVVTWISENLYSHRHRTSRISKRQYAGAAASRARAPCWRPHRRSAGGPQPSSALFAQLRGAPGTALEDFTWIALQTRCPKRMERSSHIYTPPAPSCWPQGRIRTDVHRRRRGGTPPGPPSLPLDPPPPPLHCWRLRLRAKILLQPLGAKKI